MSREQWGHGFNAGVQAANNGLKGQNGPSINAKNHMLCWTPKTSNVALVEWPDKFGRSLQYRSTALACYSNIQKMNFEQRKTMVFITAMHLIVRDGCPANVVHNVLLDLDEYRDGCADDMLREL